MEILLDDVNVFYPDYDNLTWLYKFAKIHQNMHLKWVYFIVLKYISIKLIFLK